jgi:pyruvate formate lyase activating enzyme
MLLQNAGGGFLLHGRGRENVIMPREALFYERLENRGVRCRLCGHHCHIKPDARGVCGVRENRDGTLYSLVYGKLIAENVDPIEKKPLFHVLPGSRSYSIATPGCNFRCAFCQNHEISQAPARRKLIIGRDTTPEEVVERALTTGSQSIAYTYTEPTVYFEFAYDCCRLAHEKNIRNVFVSNGYMSEEVVDFAAPFLDAINVDLKAFSEEFYKKQCGASLQPVLAALKRLKEKGIWVEITTLVIPTLNDDPSELRQLAGFIRSLGPETPWHISRFHPCYELQDIDPTPVSTIHRAVEIGKEEGLYYVYSGNVPGDAGEKTFCHHCGQLLIDRFGYLVRDTFIRDGACPQCRTPLAGLLR